MSRTFPIKPVQPNEIIEWRAFLNLSRQELADKLGVHYQTISAWENGTNRIPSMVRLAFSCLLNDVQPLLPFPETQKTPREDKEHWASWLIQVRIDLDMTQESLARALDISVWTVAKWEEKVNPIPPYLPLVISWVRQTPTISASLSNLN